MARLGPRSFTFAAIAAALGGCTTPPSVTPLLRVAEEAVRAEARRVEADAARDRAHADAARSALAAAYDADLAARGALTAEWVREATDAYVAGREALLRHALALEAERRTRAANLAAAADATRRAAEILERRDALITRATHGVDAWQLLRTRSEEEAR